MTTLPPTSKGARAIGQVVGAAPGPLVIVIAGLHGNEHSGITAVGRVCERLEELRSEFKGELHAFAGNLPALAQKIRYIDRDLNRSWTQTEIDALRERSGTELVVEDKEQKALLTLFESLIADKERPAILLDLHSTSADGAPFLFAGKSQPSKALAKTIPIPKVYEFEQYIEGTFIAYARKFDVTGFGFEAGQHDAPSSIDNHEAFLWLALEAFGNLTEDTVQERERHVATLYRASSHLPDGVRVVYRHAIEDADEFKMRPGFRHFQEVRKGDVLAEDKNGEILCPQDGILFMPLYQGAGHDGFFLGEVVTGPTH
jgi:succinylglutamate desuccinylase